MTAPETRKEVMDYRSLHQYTCHIRSGHESRDYPLEESGSPDGWIAAHYGPPQRPREDGRPGRGARRQSREIKSEDEGNGSMRNQNPRKPSKSTRGSAH